ncbi:hypothetical protein OE749_02820 [Aestuariibacter sp. AA17]|uniref:Uncharacterized protein n=1 Tax=Fluctibacter corallii TaxID=2984329 RepID=A0ABT3A4L8_9ALTE|nr:hypothetical protein [Aestuariibacter sp. AA17]MCV2883632.1 hypothetical protein [Aestuariibacter sp. AA17]
MKIIGAYLFACLLSAACTFVLASLFHTQFVLHELVKIGTEITFGTRLEMTLSDLSGLLIGYGSVIFIALLSGFLIVDVIKWKLSAIPSWRYVVAGGLSMAMALSLMQPLLGVTLIAGARSDFGFVCQIIAGLCGGWIFILLKNKRRQPPPLQKNA